MQYWWHALPLVISSDYLRFGSAIDFFTINYTIMNNKGIWISLGLGLAVGSILGVLFAPDKGSATRNRLKHSGRRVSDTLQHGMTRIKGDLQQLRDELEETLESRDGASRGTIS